jgi:hypothetical protein
LILKALCNENLCSGRPAFERSSEQQKSPAKGRGHVYVKAAARRSHIKPASHFIERHSYERVTEATLKNQVNQVRKSGP